MRDQAYVVRPEWVFDTIAAGKRKKEWDYAVIKNSTVYKLEDLGVGSSRVNQD